jgi:selenoprotein W-related protein
VEIALVPSSGGVFEVTLDGTTVFSKKQTGRHAAPGEVVGIISERMGR